jgi:hypothetical protein
MLLKNSEKGQTLILTMVLILIVGASFLAGGFIFKKTPILTDPAYNSNQCCDSGDGEACKPSETETFDWKGTNDTPEKYGLIKKKIQLAEGSGHLEPAKAPDDKGPDGNQIFLNNTAETGIAYSYCSGGVGAANVITGPGDQDSVGGGGCIPDNEIIYVCTNCPSNVLPSGTAGEFDAYYRISDGDVPDTIKNCAKSPAAIPGAATVDKFTGSNAKELQLQTLTFSAPGASLWLSPWCKPAVYLYPEETSLVSVKVNSSQPLTYTDPLYPAGGWNVIADPQGIISYRNKAYDYLYYETKVADGVLTKPTKGYVVEKNKLENLFRQILPKLGLNIKEVKQFSDYWTKTLPFSSYYFVGIVPQEELDEYSTLDINPKPASEIRVTLYFEALASMIEVEEPEIVTPIRTGFAVVEWGGIFKKDKNQKFSCFQ